MAAKLQSSIQKEAVPRRKLMIGSTLFVLLTAGVFTYLFAHTDSSVGPTWSGLRWHWALLILLALPLDPLATTTRMYLVCRVLKSKVSFWNCFKADCANFAVSTLTPSQSGGGAAQVYMLYRSGVPMGTAWTVSMISFLGTLIGLSLIGLSALLFTEQTLVRGALFVSAVSIISAGVIGMAVCAIKPGLFRVPVALLGKVIAKLRRKPYEPSGSIVDAFSRDVTHFLKHGKVAFVWVVLCTLVFLLARALLAYLCLRFLGLDGGFLNVMGVQLALMFVVYFSPTPGGAGVAESVSLLAMAAFVPLGFAPHYNLLWRCTTIYLWAIAGAVFLVQGVFSNKTPSPKGVV